MNTIPTPRTDAVQFKDRSDYHDPSAFDWFVRADLARTLERELGELLAVNATGAARLAHAAVQLAAEREKVRVLREACGHISYIPRIESALEKTEDTK